MFGMLSTSVVVTGVLVTGVVNAGLGILTIIGKGPKGKSSGIGSLLPKIHSNWGPGTTGEYREYQNYRDYCNYRDSNNLRF